MNKIFIILLLTLEYSFALCRYEIKCNNQLLQESHKIMMTQVGILEKSNKNDGEVQKYLKVVGLQGNYPYCAAGQYWCFHQAAIQLGISSKMIPIPKTALANSMFNFAKKNGVLGKFLPQKNDLIVWRKHNSYKGHIERIIAVQSKGWITTVGFNTSSYINKKYVEGVFIKKRNIFHFIGLLKTRGLIGFKQ